MNDFSDLEGELKKLRPRATAPELTSRVEQALAEPETHTATAAVTRRRRFQWNWLPIGLGLTAAAGFLLLARTNVEKPVSKPATLASASPAAPAFAAGNFVPAGVTQVVYHTRDEGLHFEPGAERPVRQLRASKRETLQWHNPETGASLRVSYPSEEVTLIPVSGQ